MTRAIAIDTSGQVGSIALTEDARALGVEQFPHGLQHAAQILPIIDRLTRAQGWAPRDIHQLYISIGPGSFTGLRISVTLGKTMALATGVKIVAVPTVRVLAENAPPEARHVIIVLDAKRDQIFTARFEKEASGFGVQDSGEKETVAKKTGTGTVSIAPERGEKTGTGTVFVVGHGSKVSSATSMLGWIEREPAHLDSLAAMLQRAPRPVHLLGEGIPYHQKFIPADDASIIITPPESWRARAEIVALIGRELAARWQFADPLALAPIYIRRPEAEEKLMASGTTS